MDETWQPRASIPQNSGEGSLAGTALGNKIYVLNGDKAGGGTILQVYSTITDSWSTGTGLSSHFESAAAVAFGEIRLNLQFPTSSPKKVFTQVYTSGLQGHQPTESGPGL